MKGPDIGGIKIESHLPEVFKDAKLRLQLKESIVAFEAKHGSLPLKFRIEEFCFQRPEQICTADSARKYLAWSAEDQDVTRQIFSSLQSNDLPLVLRSHPLIFEGQSPVFQLLAHTELVDLQRRLANDNHPSDAWDNFFERIASSSTVVQLLKNPYAQKGLFLCRPTFIYDREMRDEIGAHKEAASQYISGPTLSCDAPDELVSMRVVPLGNFAREKKRRMGGLFVYNKKTKTFDARGGFPYAAKPFLEDWYGSDSERMPIGRSVDLQKSGRTTLHYDDGSARQNPYDPLFLTEADLSFLQTVLSWQLPRIIQFEDEIREQSWIPQGYSNTHQFVVFPPEQLGGQEINTQYFDFRPYASRSELMSALKTTDLNDVPTEKKIMTLF